MFHHGRNLGLFVLIYKSICCLCRNAGFHGGKESLLAGFVGTLCPRASLRLAPRASLSRTS